MKLSTYKIRGNNDELIGVVENNSLINLNKFFGQISLKEILKLTKEFVSDNIPGSFNLSSTVKDIYNEVLFNVDAFVYGIKLNDYLFS